MRGFPFLPRLFLCGGQGWDRRDRTKDVFLFDRTREMNGVLSLYVLRSTEEAVFWKFLGSLMVTARSHLRAMHKHS